jgi:hypothetical protein
VRLELQDCFTLKPERSIDPKLMRLLDQTANVVVDDLAEDFVERAARAETTRARAEIRNGQVPGKGLATR